MRSSDNQLTSVTIGNSVKSDWGRGVREQQTDFGGDSQLGDLNWEEGVPQQPTDLRVKIGRRRHRQLGLVRSLATY